MMMKKKELEVCVGDRMQTVAIQKGISNREEKEEEEERKIQLEL